MAISKADLEVLDHPALAMPRARTAGPFDEFLTRGFREFFSRTESLQEPLATHVSRRRPVSHALADALVASWRLGAAGAWSDADRRMDTGLAGVGDILLSMSKRHSEKMVGSRSWYRIAAWQGVNSRGHMFHAPFEMPQKTYRFSTPGLPTLYLANSVYLCWLECRQPDIGACFVSRFELDTSGMTFLDLPFSHQAYLDPLRVTSMLPMHPIDPRWVTNSPYRDDVMSELADYLTLWPLLVAVSVQRLLQDETPEYVLPQLLMRWTQRSPDFLGVRYFTAQDDQSTNSQDWSVNLALPARSEKTRGFCDFLRARARCTEPQALAPMQQVPLSALVTREAGERRQQSGGRCMLRWPDGSMEDYIGTVFGKMEYWLDRPEIEVREVDDS